MLLDHVLGEQTPAPGDLWRLRKGERVIRIDTVHEGCVYAHCEPDGRSTGMLLETLRARYVKVVP
jgi:hypothetical protein